MKVKFKWYQLYIILLSMLLYSCNIGDFFGDCDGCGDLIREINVDISSLDINETSPLGFSAADIINHIKSHPEATFRWVEKRYEGSEVRTILTIEETGSYNFHDYEDDSECRLNETDSTEG